MSHVSWPELISLLVVALLVAKGAYELTRRRPWALFVVSIPGLVLLAKGATVLAAVYLGLSLLVFGLPLLLAFVESRERRA